MHASAQAQETITRLVPGGKVSLSQLSDDELLTSTRRLVGASNRLFAQLLLHLAEVEARGIHRTRACASLYTYCIYELRMSEDAAARRSSAARLVKRFPLLFHAVASGELHLTGLLMVGPHLTPENHVEVLARAKFRTKKELAKLVRELHPLPRVPDVIEPLGPEPRRSLREPTWQEWVTSLCPPMRDLRAGEAPRDWANDPAADESPGAARFPEEETPSSSEAPTMGGEDSSSAASSSELTSSTAPARRELPPVTAPQQYQMQFSTTEEHVRLVERAKALLARSSAGVSLGELHVQAMQLLVEKLEQARFAVTQRSRKAPRSLRSSPSNAAPTRKSDSRRAAPRSPGDDSADPSEQPLRRRGDDSTDPSRPLRRRGGDRADPNGRPPRQRGDDSARLPCRRADDRVDPPRTAPRQRGRYVPAAVKREVFARDAGCCSYVDVRGHRCAETRYLELHHLQPFAHGGEHIASNLALRCAAHNALAAEDDFGRDVIDRKRHDARHHARSALERARPPLRT